MADLTERIASKPEPSSQILPEPASIWQEWAKKRAHIAPTLEQVKEITKKIKVNVTQHILDDRLTKLPEN